MFITPIQLTTTMNSSHFHTHGWASDNSTPHLGFADVHQHLEDNSHLFDEIIQYSHLVMVSTAASLQQPKSTTLFQFFDGWPMTEL